MLELVDVGPRSLSAYRGVAPDAVLDDLVRRTEELRGARVLHVNATPYGGGVSELLRSEVPILNDLGLIAHWKIIRGDGRFFQVTKKVHNGLQGAADGVTETEREAYLGTSRRNAELLEEEYDFVFLHDPQPAGIPSLRGKGNARWIWRCHIDTSRPNPSVWAFLHDYLDPWKDPLGVIAAYRLAREEGNAGGIPLQMAAGAGGVLVQTVEECAKAVVALLRDPEHARDLARKGRARVREHFLLPRLLLNELGLMQELCGRPANRRRGAPRPRVWDAGQRGRGCAGGALCRGDVSLLLGRLPAALPARSGPLPDAKAHRLTARGPSLVRRRRHVDRIRRSHGLDVALVDCRARPAGALRLGSCSRSRIAVATTGRGLTGNDPQATLRARRGRQGGIRAQADGSSPIEARDSGAVAAMKKAPQEYAGQPKRAWHASEDNHSR